MPINNNASPKLANLNKSKEASFSMVVSRINLGAFTGPCIDRSNWKTRQVDGSLTRPVEGGRLPYWCWINLLGRFCSPGSASKSFGFHVCARSFFRAGPGTSVAAAKAFDRSGSGSQVQLHCGALCAAVQRKAGLGSWGWQDNRIRDLCANLGVTLTSSPFGGQTSINISGSMVTTPSLVKLALSCCYCPGRSHEFWPVFFLTNSPDNHDIKGLVPELVAMQTIVRKVLIHHLLNKAITLRNRWAWWCPGLEIFPCPPSVFNHCSGIVSALLIWIFFQLSIPNTNCGSSPCRNICF